MNHDTLPPYTEAARAVQDAQALRAAQTPVELAYPINDPEKLAAAVHQANLEAQFLQAQRMASIGMLAGGIAQDVLNSVLMVCGLLEELPSNEPSKQLVRTMEQKAQRGAAFLKQVLTLARGATSKTGVVQPTPIIRDVKHLLREAFPRPITIRTEIEKDLWNIRGNPTQLEQVLINLSVNALAAMPEGGTLHITAGNTIVDEEYASLYERAQPGAYVVIKVSDTGTGIPADRLDKIFEPPGKGAGLGLSTVRSIVESQHGFIHVYSESGKGTTVVVALPVAETTARLSLARGHGELILFADDEATIRKLGKAILERNGYKVLTARNGEEAVSLYKQHQHHIRVVITDIMMPLMDGIGTIQALVEIDPQVKILAMSGFHNNERLVQIVQAGAHAFLPKPFTAEQLLLAVLILKSRAASTYTYT